MKALSIYFPPAGSTAITPQVTASEFKFFPALAAESFPFYAKIPNDAFDQTMHDLFAVTDCSIENSKHNNIKRRKSK